MSKQISEQIGKQARFLTGAFAFYMWQQNAWAALFVYMALVTVDQAIE